MTERVAAQSAEGDRAERTRRAAEALAHYFGGGLHSDDAADWELDARIALDASGYPADLTNGVRPR